jgi:hypothetical protein
LNPVSYRWKARPQREQRGFIADEAGDGETVNLAELLALTVAPVKALEVRLEEMRLISSR